MNKKTNGIEEMRATRQRVESMLTALPNDYGCDVDCGGFLYYGCFHIEDYGDQFCVTVCNDGLVGSLEECEVYLYENWVKENR
jgi:hypothetical protein